MRQAYSSTQGRDLRWLAWSSANLLLLLLIWIPASALGGIWAWALAGGQLIMFYLLGWYGLRQQAVFLPPAEASPRKYERSGMTDAAQSEIGARLTRRLLEQRDFLEPDLKLGELADRIGTSPQLLSQYFNEALGQSFFDYVNAQRVAEVQRMLALPEHAESILLDLAHAAGFNSKTTFNGAFKKVSGLSPSAWRKAHVTRPAPSFPAR
jgi:AraC-like DNA-binding protein